MRWLVPAVIALTLAPLPALAQDADRPRSDADKVTELTDQLGDPENQLRAQLLARALSAMVLELPVGPLARAAAEMKGDDAESIDPDLTVREFAGPAAEDLPAQIGERIPEMMDRLAGMSGAVEEMMPALRRWAETLREVGEPARD